MGGLLGRAFGQWGLDRFDVVLALYQEWEDIAPEPWRSHAHPVLLHSGELTVEAASPGGVSLLRYAVGDLLRVLDARFGEGVIGTVRVQAPRPGRPGP